MTGTAEKDQPVVQTSPRIDLNDADIRSMVNLLWPKYDEDDLGELDKIETANFVNEVFVSKGLGPPSMERFNSFFSTFEKG